MTDLQIQATLTANGLQNLAAILRRRGLTNSFVVALEQHSADLKSAVALEIEAEK